MRLWVATGDPIKMSEQTAGLGAIPQEDWIKFPASGVEKLPIELLHPKKQKLRHDTVLKYLKDRIAYSERKMATFYARWGINEMKLQAYISLKDQDALLKERVNNKGMPPAAVKIMVPSTWAAVSTISTYLLHTFCGRRPIFQVAAYQGQAAQAAQAMEAYLQYNADHIRLTRQINQHIWDGQTYGVGIFRTAWKTEKAMRTTVSKAAPRLEMGLQTEGELTRTRELRTVFQGTDVLSIDPYCFFPDPRVPMAEVNRKGEFVSWRTFEGRHDLMKLAVQGKLHYVEYAGDMPGDSTSAASRRGLRVGSTENPREQTAFGGKSFVQVDQGTYWVIPKELGIGEGTTPELWLFTVLNKNVIVQAEKLDNDHGMHPVAISEPLSTGYGFGQLSTCDMHGDFQDTLSWLVNSHIDNVRASLNNMWIVDPSMIEIEDMKKPGPGKFIRLKQSAIGRDVRSAINQFAVADVTRGHFSDFDNFMRIADTISGVSDNLRGINMLGGRKSATEVRITSESGTSRLAAQARLISSQSLIDLVDQMSLNAQQYLDNEFSLHVLGANSVHISPETLVGDFHFAVHDGTLPLDKVAILDIWKELFGGIAQDQELRQQFDIVKIFEYLAKLSGAEELDSFRRMPQPGQGAAGMPQVSAQVMPPEMLEAQAQAGNAIPLGGL